MTCTLFDTFPVLDYNSIVDACWVILNYVHDSNNSNLATDTLLLFSNGLLDNQKMSLLLIYRNIKRCYAESRPFRLDIRRLIILIDCLKPNRLRCFENPWLTNEKKIGTVEQLLAPLTTNHCTIYCLSISFWPFSVGTSTSTLKQRRSWIHCEKRTCSIVSNKFAWINLRTGEKSI